MDVKINQSVFNRIKEGAGKKAPELLMKALDEAFERGEVEVSWLFIDSINSISEMKNISRAEEAARILRYFNEVTERNFKPSPTNISLVVALLKEYDSSKIKSVILNKAGQWKDHYELCKYLRPSTIFRKTNFDNYVNEPMQGEAFEHDFKNQLDSLLKGGKEE